MKSTSWVRWSVAAVSLFLLSCGGGGGGGSPEPAPVQELTIPSDFYGVFHSQACEAADDVNIVATGAAASVRSYVTVEQRSGKVAGFALRFDFYDHPSCTGNPVAYLSFDDPSNQVEFVGTTPVAGGLTGYKVLVTLAAPSGGTVIGNRVEFGGAIVLSAPSALFSAKTLKDLWVYGNNVLYEGSDVYIADDGFPAVPNMSVGDERVASVEPMLAACAAAPVTWGGGACSGTAPMGAGGNIETVLDFVGPGTGSAAFTCTAGSWALQTGSSCTP